MTYMRSVSYLRNVCNSTTVLHDASGVSHGEKSALVSFSAMLVFRSLEVGPFTTLITLYSAIICTRCREIGILLLSYFCVKEQSNLCSAIRFYLTMTTIMFNFDIINIALSISLFCRGNVVFTLYLVLKQMQKQVNIVVNDAFLCKVQSSLLY